ncbi:peptidylprolyl isomerase [Pontibacter burrus]|uniref:Periplasmic chaperone PpiD n=1 Tax=Pontibacter burrus TaxID=2704466 RepID=A0A6B3LRY0_9BACT|nr:peptidylprolyl isomerase [Pontibacter burrus]NEM96327.1 peptidylprolyl isomerase [Pontibacter burrus]
MALINKIREKSGWAVGAIAIGLGVFVVGGDLLGPNSRLLGNSATEIGEIAGQTIDYQEFDNVLQPLKANYEAQTGRSANENEMAMLREQAWNQLIFKIALEKEYERLGIEVSEEELFDMVQGNNIHPAVRQAFTNPQTGEFSQAQVVEYLQNMTPQDRPMWVNFEQGLATERVRTKYSNLLSKSVYVTTAEAKKFFNAQSSTASVKVMYVPYFTVSDSAISVTDAQLKDFYERNKELYKIEDGRSIEYVTIPVMASDEDNKLYEEEMAAITDQFEAATNDSAFVNANSDVPFNGAYLNPGQLPERLRNETLNKGEVFGPYTTLDSYTLYKVVDVKEGNKSAARASHILIQPTADTPEAKAEAKAKATDVLNQIKKGADFAQMARQYGSDGTASTGGDLGWFESGQMVAPFEKAVFGAKSAGLLPELVETEYGYHIVRVTAPKTNRTYKIATIEKSTEPSEATRDAAYALADEISGTSENLEGFRAKVAEHKDLVKQDVKDIGKNNIVAGSLTNARELVRWTYDRETKVGDVSPVFEIGDEYVVAVLTGKREKGYAKVQDVKDELTAAVRNELKAKQIIEKINKTKGTVDQMAAAYGPDAMVRSAEDVTLASGTIPGIGLEPVAVGKAFALKPGTRTAPFEGNGGVMVVELNALSNAPQAADLSGVQHQLVNMRSGNEESKAFEAIKEKSNIVDNRVKFF